MSDPFSLTNVSDPQTWGSFDAAWQYHQAGQCDDIGFVLSPDDPYVGIDLDHCMNTKTGKLTPQAEDLVRRLQSYTELNPSGSGNSPVGFMYLTVIMDWYSPSAGLARVEYARCRTLYCRPGRSPQALWAPGDL